MNKIICPLSLVAKKLPQQPAIVSTRRTITFEALDQIVNVTVKNFSAKGIRAGSRIAIVAANSVEYLIALLALWRLGAVACPINPRFPVLTIPSMLKSINCRFLLTDSKRYFNKSTLQHTFGNIINLKTKTKSIITANRIDLDAPATILFTSGSSGEPKAVLHSYGNHFYNAKGSNQNIKIRPGDCWLLSLPLYHVGGLGILFRGLMAGGAIAVPETPSDLAGALKNSKITHLSLVATQLYRLLQNKSILKKLRSLKAILVGGSFVPQSLITKSFQNQLSLYKSYGLTEMASQVITVSRQTNRSAKNCLPFRQIKISKTGEILVRGKTLFRGYVRRNKLVLPLTKDGWFRTGDLGRFNERKELVVIGRRDNMFISGGENIYPEEIEKIICEHLGILKAIVLPVKHAQYGFRPVAFVKLQKPTARGVLVKYLERHLPRFKIPDTLYYWPENIGKEKLKVSRPSLQQLVQKKPALFKQLS